MSFEKLKNIVKIFLLCGFSILTIYIMFKLFVFYVPFLIGFIIAEILEPLIKFIKNKTKLTRKTSSILVLIIFFVICVSIILLGTVFLISEASNFLSGLNRIY